VSITRPSSFITAVTMFNSCHPR